MTRRTILTLTGLPFLAAALVMQPWGVRAQSAGGVQWIWTDEGNPLIDAPAGKRYFRRAFTINRPLPRPVDEATLEITADNTFKVWVNGAEVGQGNSWEKVFHFDVTKHLVHGANLIAVEAHNDGGPAGLMARLFYIPNGQTRQVLVSDGDWKAAREARNGWQKLDFDDNTWAKAKALGAYGKVGPWKLADGAQHADRFTVPEGFRVEQAVKPPDDDKVFSLVNMTFDAKGRLLLSRENGPALLCTDPDKDGVCQTVRPYCTQVTNSQGMCWVDDALLLVGNGPRGVGLYRCRDTKGQDKIDEVTLLHKFKGGMAEHGPHAIVHGPDGWLYLVMGNHAWAQPDKLADNSPLRRWPKGVPGPDQGKPGTKEDVLLPRLNDGRGHAANILAPGGTIWRLDKNGKNMSLFSAGYRNHFDAAFNPSGELFTFDSDMEWDEDLPWYRRVRICHVTPGADFVWRTGAANTPNYYIDSLPPVAETGRGSPVGVTFYDHSAFPKKYRGGCFLADWSIGAIWVLRPERVGATCKGKAEKFCTGAPMNVSDLEVGPDGALYFTTGGRGTQGGVFRIVATTKLPTSEPTISDQPLAAWSRARTSKAIAKDGKLARKYLDTMTFAGQADPAKCLEAFRVLQIQGWLTRSALIKAGVDGVTVLEMTANKYPEIRAAAVRQEGIETDMWKGAKQCLIDSLDDEDALVRRRACEALIRSGFEPPVDAVWKLLNDPDKFVRTAARLVIQRIDPKKWVERIAKDQDLAAWEGIVALCKEDKAAAYTDLILRRLDKEPTAEGQRLLDCLRTVQLAAIHTTGTPSQFKTIAERCLRMFPHKEPFVNRELAILLTYFQNTKALSGSVAVKLVEALKASAGDRPQQIHYFYCLRLIKDGWTPAAKSDIAAWYASTEDWSGGASLTPFLENIFREVLDVFTPAEKKAFLAAAEMRPLPALVLAQRLQNEREASLLPDLRDLANRLDQEGKINRKEDLRQAVSLARVRIALTNPTTADLPDLVQGLNSPNKLVVGEVIEALSKVPAKPKAEEPAPYRAVLLAARRLDEKQSWKAVELLRHWSNGRRFSTEDGDWKHELGSWAGWFAQAFPKEPTLPDVAGDKPVASKYKFEDLAAFLQDEGKAGDVAKGRLIFEKAQCLKCHKYGKEGEGIGPDLTTLSKRFKRHDVLESLYYPSRVISDQYRSTTIFTKKGQQVVGLAAPQGDQITVLQSDGTKIMLKKDDIEQQVASLVSVMPEKLLDTLDRREIADLFAYMESEPAK